MQLIGTLSLCRHCLWILGNEATLIKRCTIWKDLVINAKYWGCFYNADEDKSFAQAVTVALVEHNQIHILLNMDSFLPKKARWKVCWLNNFFPFTIFNDTSTIVSSFYASFIKKLWAEKLFYFIYGSFLFYNMKNLLTSVSILSIKLVWFVHNMIKLLKKWRGKDLIIVSQFCSSPWTDIIRGTTY